MKKFISWWMGFAVASVAIAIDFYIAIHKNQNPTGEQILVTVFFIAFFAIFSFVCACAHIEENVIKKRED